ncbi:hypothetical protein BH10PSE12_BH10PSE12_11810 [soil metagenome]
MIAGILHAQLTAPPIPNDRREQERAVAVLINAGIAQHGRDGLCRIRNLSTGGIMVETRVPLAVDATAWVQLKSGRQVEGSVRWSKGNLAGIALASADAEEVLNERTQPASAAISGAFPRFARSASASIINNHRRSRCGVTAISLADVSLSGLCDLVPDQILRVAIDGLGEHLARISHVEGEDALAMFAQPLLFRALEQWLDAAQMPLCQINGPKSLAI